MPFLTIITRSYQRPDLLARNVRSVAQQTVPDVDHLIVHDALGRGIAWTHTQMVDLPVRGDYVMVLDDDDYLIQPEFVAQLKAAVATAAPRPDVILFQMDMGDRVLPERFDQIERGRVAVSCWAVERFTWHEHACDFVAAYDGDFDFLAGVLACKTRHNRLWLDTVAARVDRVSHGAPQ